MKKIPGVWTCLLVLLFSCQTEKQEIIEDSVSGEKLFTQMPSNSTGIHFKNEIHEKRNFNAARYDYFYNGGGVAIGDINNDGLQDIFFTGNSSTNKLYLNKGGLKFEDISKSAGIANDRWSTGVVMADINNDGYLDIYVCNSGPFNDKLKQTNQMFINNKDNTFSDVALQAGIDDEAHSTHASFF